MPRPPTSTLFPYTTLFRSYMPHTGPARRTTFTVRIENVSTASTLRLSNGQTAPAPNAPGLWVVHDERSEEHTSELQSHSDLVCRLLLEKKKRRERRCRA